MVRSDQGKVHMKFVGMLQAQGKARSAATLGLNMHIKTNPAGMIVIEALGQERSDVTLGRAQSQKHNDIILGRAQGHITLGSACLSASFISIL